eukprot:759438-Hanusia_phi.AAC.3
MVAGTQDLEISSRPEQMVGPRKEGGRGTAFRSKRQPWIGASTRSRCAYRLVYERGVGVRRFRQGERAVLLK